MRGWLAVGGIVLVLILIWQTFGQELQPPTPEPDRQIATQATMTATIPAGGPVKLNHPSGAIVSAPEGAFSPSAQVRLETLEKSPSTAPFVASSPVYRLQAYSLLAPTKLVTLDLPSGSAGERAVVLVYAGPNWLRVPSQSITLPDGKPGQRVNIDGVPPPWVFTVAAPPEGKEADRKVVAGASGGAVLARLEQLRWTDRAAFAAEIETQDPETLGWASVGPAPLALVTVAEAAERNASGELFVAKVFFYKAQLAVDQKNREEAFRQYKQGLDHLWAAREKYDPIKDADATSSDEIVLYGTPSKGEAQVITISDLRLSLGDMIQYDCGRFAPWGLQLMITLAKEGLINEREFDIRVLPFYGSEDWTDVGVPKLTDAVPPIYGAASDTLAQNWEIDELRMAKQLKILDGKAYRNEFVRFYSPRVIDDWTLADILAKAKDFHTYASALVAAVALGTGAAEGGAAAWAVWEVSQPIIEKLFLEEEIAGVKESHGPAIGMAVATGYEAAKGLGSFWHDGMEVSASSLNGMYTDALLTWFIDLAARGGSTSSLDVLTDLRRATEGTQGYLDNSGSFVSGHYSVPPVMLLAAIWGPTADSPKNYPQGAQAFLVWSLTYNTLPAGKSYDLDGAFPKNKGDQVQKKEEISSFEFTQRLKKSKNLLMGLPWAPFKQDQWLTWQYDTDPVQQQMRFGIDATVFKSWADAQGLSVDDLEKKLKLEVYENDCSLSTCRLLPEDPSQDVTLADARRGGDDKANWYAVRVYGRLADWRRNLEVPDTLVPDDYAGPLFHIDRRPLYRYTVRLSLPKGKDKPETLAEIPIIFKREEVESFLGEDALRVFDPASGNFVDRNKPQVFRREVVSFLKPGVWYMGEGFPHEVALTPKEGKLVGSYRTPGGLNKVEFRRIACPDQEGAEKVICFEANWPQPNVLTCQYWDIKMVGYSVDGVSYEANYSSHYDCTGPNPEGQDDIHEEQNRNFDVKGKWLRDYTGGQVDDRFDPPEPTAEPPVGTNPIANEGPLGGQ